MAMRAARTVAVVAVTLRLAFADFCRPLAPFINPALTVHLHNSDNPPLACLAYNESGCVTPWSSLPAHIPLADARAVRFITTPRGRNFLFVGTGGSTLHPTTMFEAMWTAAGSWQVLQTFVGYHIVDVDVGFNAVQNAVILAFATRPGSGISPGILRWMDDPEQEHWEEPNGFTIPAATTVALLPGAERVLFGLQHQLFLFSVEGIPVHTFDFDASEWITHCDVVEHAGAVYAAVARQGSSGNLLTILRVEDSSMTEVASINLPDDEIRSAIVVDLPNGDLYFGARTVSSAASTFSVVNLLAMLEGLSVVPTQYAMSGTSQNPSGSLSIIRFNQRAYLVFPEDSFTDIVEVVGPDLEVSLRVTIPHYRGLASHFFVRDGMPYLALGTAYTDGAPDDLIIYPLGNQVLPSAEEPMSSNLNFFFGVSGNGDCVQQGALGDLRGRIARFSRSSTQNPVLGVLSGGVMEDVDDLCFEAFPARIQLSYPGAECVRFFKVTMELPHELHGLGWRPLLQSSWLGSTVGAASPGLPMTGTGSVEWTSVECTLPYRGTAPFSVHTFESANRTVAGCLHYAPRLSDGKPMCVRMWTPTPRFLREGAAVASAVRMIEDRVFLFVALRDLRGPLTGGDGVQIFQKRPGQAHWEVSQEFGFRTVYDLSPSVHSDETVFASRAESPFLTSFVWNRANQVFDETPFLLPLGIVPTRGWDVDSFAWRGEGVLLWTFANAFSGIPRPQGLLVHAANPGVTKLWDLPGPSECEFFDWSALGFAVCAHNVGFNLVSLWSLGRFLSDGYEPYQIGEYVANAMAPPLSDGFLEAPGVRVVNDTLTGKVVAIVSHAGVRPGTWAYEGQLRVFDLTRFLVENDFLSVAFGDDDAPWGTPRMLIPAHEASFPDFGLAKLNAFRFRRQWFVGVGVLGSSEAGEPFPPLVMQLDTESLALDVVARVPSAGAVQLSYFFADREPVLFAATLHIPRFNASDPAPIEFVKAPIRVFSVGDRVLPPADDPAGQEMLVFLGSNVDRERGQGPHVAAVDLIRVAPRPRTPLKNFLNVPRRPGAERPVWTDDPGDQSYDDDRGYSLYTADDLADDDYFNRFMWDDDDRFYNDDARYPAYWYSERFADDRQDAYDDFFVNRNYQPSNYQDDDPGLSRRERSLRSTVGDSHPLHDRVAADVLGMPNSRFAPAPPLADEDIALLNAANEAAFPIANISSVDANEWSRGRPRAPDARRRMATGPASSGRLPIVRPIPYDPTIFFPIDPALPQAYGGGCGFVKDEVRAEYVLVMSGPKASSVERLRFTDRLPVWTEGWRPRLHFEAGARGMNFSVVASVVMGTLDDDLRWTGRYNKRDEHSSIHASINPNDYALQGHGCVMFRGPECVEMWSAPPRTVSLLADASVVRYFEASGGRFVLAGFAVPGRQVRVLRWEPSGAQWIQYSDIGVSSVRDAAVFIDSSDGQPSVAFAFEPEATQAQRVVWHWDTQSVNFVELPSSILMLGTRGVDATYVSNLDITFLLFVDVNGSLILTDKFGHTKAVRTGTFRDCEVTVERDDIYAFCTYTESLSSVMTITFSDLSGAPVVNHVHTFNFANRVSGITLDHADPSRTLYVSTAGITILSVSYGHSVRAWNLSLSITTRFANVSAEVLVNLGYEPGPVVPMPGSERRSLFLVPAPSGQTTLFKTTNNGAEPIVTLSVPSIRSGHWFRSFIGHSYLLLLPTSTQDPVWMFSTGQVLAAPMDDPSGTRLAVFVGEVDDAMCFQESMLVRSFFPLIDRPQMIGKGDGVVGKVSRQLASRRVPFFMDPLAGMMAPAPEVLEAHHSITQRSCVTSMVIANTAPDPLVGLYWALMVAATNRILPTFEWFPVLSQRPELARGFALRRKHVPAPPVLLARRLQQQQPSLPAVPTSLTVIVLEGRFLGHRVVVRQRFARIRELGPDASTLLYHVDDNTLMVGFHAPANITSVTVEMVVDEFVTNAVEVPLDFGTVSHLWPGGVLPDPDGVLPRVTVSIHGSNFPPVVESAFLDTVPCVEVERLSATEVRCVFERYHDGVKRWPVWQGSTEAENSKSLPVYVFGAHRTSAGLLHTVVQGAVYPLWLVRASTISVVEVVGRVGRLPSNESSTLRVSGFGLGFDVRDIRQVRVGKSFPCVLNATSFQPSVGFDCTVAGGVGSDLNVEVTLSSGVSLMSEHTVSFEPPVIETVTPPFLAWGPQPTTFVLRGRGLGFPPFVNASVEIDGRVGVCASVLTVSATEVRCENSALVNDGSSFISDPLSFILYAENQESPKKSIPVFGRPFVDSVEPVRNVPVQGPTYFRLFGDIGEVTSLARVWIGPHECAVDLIAGGDVVDCVLAAGWGVNHTVVLETVAGGMVEARGPENRVSFAPPTLTSVEPSVFPRNTDTTFTVTLQGTDLAAVPGLEVREVWIGGARCPTVLTQSSSVVECRGLSARLSPTGDWTTETATLVTAWNATVSLPITIETIQLTPCPAPRMLESDPLVNALFLSPPLPSPDVVFPAPPSLGNASTGSDAAVALASCRRWRCPAGWTLAGSVLSPCPSAGTYLSGEVVPGSECWWSGRALEPGSAACVLDRILPADLSVVAADRCGSVVRVQWTRPRDGPAAPLPMSVVSTAGQRARLDSQRRRGLWSGVLRVRVLEPQTPKSPEDDGVPSDDDDDDGEAVEIALASANVSLTGVGATPFGEPTEVLETTVRVPLPTEAAADASLRWVADLFLVDRAGREDRVVFELPSPGSSNGPSTGGTCSFVSVAPPDTTPNPNPSAEEAAEREARRLRPGSGLDTLLGSGESAQTRARLLTQTTISSPSDPFLFASERQSLPLVVELPVAPAVGEVVSLTCETDPSSLATASPPTVSVSAATWATTSLALDLRAAVFDANNSNAGRDAFTFTCAVTSVSTGAEPPQYGNATAAKVFGAVVNEVWPYFEDVLVKSPADNTTWISVLGRWEVAPVDAAEDPETETENENDDEDNDEVSVDDDAPSTPFERLGGGVLRPARDAPGLFALTLSGALELIFVGDERQFLARGRPHFSPQTRVFLGSPGAEAALTVLAVSENGRFLRARAPSFSSVCASASACLGSRGYRALRVENPPVVVNEQGAAVEMLDAAELRYEHLGLVWRNLIASGDASAEADGGMEPEPNASRRRVSTSSTSSTSSTTSTSSTSSTSLDADDSLGMSVRCPPSCPGEGGRAMHELNDVEAARVVAASRSGVYYTDQCVGFETDPIVCLATATAGQCAWGSADGCTRCPTGGLCPGGYRLWSQPGYWVASESARAAVRCPEPSARCLGWSTDEAVTLCAAGYRPGSVACSACAPGYYPSLGACAACPADAGEDSTDPWPSLRRLLIVVGIFALFGFVMHWATKWALRSLGRSTANAGRMVKHMVFWTAMVLQVIASVGKSASAGLPEYLQTMYSFLGVFLLDPSFAAHPDCLHSPPFVSDLVLMGTVLVLLNAFLLALVLAPTPWPRDVEGANSSAGGDVERGNPVPNGAVLVNSPLRASSPASPVAGSSGDPSASPLSKEPSSSSSSSSGLSACAMRGARIRHQLLSFLTLLYPFTTATVLNILYCRPDATEELDFDAVERNPSSTVVPFRRVERFVLATNPYIVCYEGMHFWATVVAAVVLLLYVVGYPLGTWLWVHAHIRRALVWVGARPDEGRLSRVTEIQAAMRVVGRSCRLRMRHGCGCGLDTWGEPALESDMSAFSDAATSASKEGASSSSSTSSSSSSSMFDAMRRRISMASALKTPPPSSSPSPSSSSSSQPIASSSPLSAMGGSSTALITSPLALHNNKGLAGPSSSSSASSSSSSAVWTGGPMRSAVGSVSWVTRLTPREAEAWLERQMDVSGGVMNDPNVRHFVLADFRASQFVMRQLNFAALFSIALITVVFRTLDLSFELALLRFVFFAVVLGSFFLVLLCRRPYTPENLWKSAVKQYSLLLSILGAFLNLVVYCRTELRIDFFGDAGTTGFIDIASMVVFGLSIGLLLTLFLAYWAVLLRGGRAHRRLTESLAEPPAQTTSPTTEAAEVGLVDLLSFRRAEADRAGADPTKATGTGGASGSADVLRTNPLASASALAGLASYGAADRGITGQVMKTRR